MADNRDYSNLRTVFAGTPDFAAAHLQALLDAGAQVAAVYTQPDRPAGRGKKLAPGPVKQVAQAAGLPVMQPLSLKDPATQETFAALQADIFVVVAYGLIIPRTILEMPRYGCVNVHASLLPRWRGAAPIQRAIEAGDRHTGVTIMKMDEGLDTGDLLTAVQCDIDPGETGGSLHDKLLALGPPALLASLSAIADGSAAPHPQDGERACYASKISKGEARLDWRRPAPELERQVRAFNPLPVAHALLEAQQIRIWQARALDRPGGNTPGTIVAVGPQAVEVACGEQVLALEEMQLPGKKRLPAADLVRGYPHLFAPGNHFDGAAE